MVNIKEKIIDVDDILNSLTPKQKEITQNLRELIKSTVPESTELIRHQNFTYKLNDKDFVWIKNYQGHVDLEFIMGASLDSGLLKDRGMEESENTRHVRINNFDKVKPEVARLLKAAAALGFEHCSTLPK